MKSVTASTSCTVFAVITALFFTPLLVLSRTTTVAAFVTPSTVVRTQRPSHFPIYAKKRKPSRAGGGASTPTFIGADTNFEGIDLAKALGVGTLKKKARKSKRVLNQNIRDGSVVQDERGVWVPKKAN